MIKKVSHIGIGVENLEEARSFSRRILRWPVRIRRISGN
jgi:catechol 2,3-dioxygenase-like lactoylglutathione lyase family enzyme